MGTGKTTIAKKICGMSGMVYVSTDELIEKREGAPIKEIFEKKGEPYFRKLEEEIVESVSAMDNAVVDTGGGVVMNERNIINLKKNGVLISLWSEADDIYKRTKKYSHRPILNVPDPMKKINELLEKRKPQYEKADYHVNTSSVGIDEAAQAVLGYARKK